MHGTNLVFFPLHLYSACDPVFLGEFCEGGERDKDAPPHPSRSLGFLFFCFGVFSFCNNVTCVAHKHAGISTPSRKEKGLREGNMSCEAKPVEPHDDVSLVSAPIETVGTALQTNIEKTLKDAVKSKHKRKKKASSTGGS